MAATTHPQALELPKPLEPGALLNGRFAVDSVLGQGGFTIAYLAVDERRHDLCVLLELAPRGARGSSGRTDLAVFGEDHATRLRQAFLNEAKHIARLNNKHLRSVRAQFCELGTAFLALEHLSGAKPLSERLAVQGRLEYQPTLDFVLAGLGALQSAHAAHVLHLDIRPTSFLQDEKDRTFLIGFGAARAWHEEALGLKPGLNDLPFRAPEMDNPRLRRGPATDLYALCAVAYTALAGSPPPDAEFRAQGRALTPVRAVAPGVPIGFARAIEKGLNLAYAGRPQSAEELRQLLSLDVKAEEAELELESFDEKAARLVGFRFDRFECMVCRGVLEAVKPLRRFACPVCHEGTVRVRHVEPHLCPICRSAPLRKRRNAAPLALCPICKTGLIAKVKKGFFSKEFSLKCMECEAGFEIDGESLVYRPPALEDPDAPGELRTEAEWRALSGRALEFWLCEGCGAQLDALNDGRLELKLPERASRYATLYPLEWARVAAGLPAFAGNAECDSCGADYDLQGERITLLAAHQDPYGFAERFSGRPLSVDDVCWLGVGKQSQHVGSICLDCGTEFDSIDGYLRLIQTAHPALVGRIGQDLVKEDWHRAALELPLLSEEAAFEADFDKALVTAFRSGRASLKRRGDVEVLWNASAQRFRVEETEWVPFGRGRLQVTTVGLKYSSLLRGLEIPLEAIKEVDAREDRLYLVAEGLQAPLGFELAPSPLAAKLRSGTRTVTITAHDLALRLKWQLSLNASP